MNEPNGLRKYLSNIKVDTYKDLLGINHSLGLPLKSFSHLHHLQISLRERKSKSTVQPEEIESKLIL